MFGVAALLDRTPVAAEIGGAVDGREVREGLGEVAAQPLGGGVVFLTQEADIVAQSQQLLEELHGILLAAKHQISIDEPEAASQKHAFAGGQTVTRLRRVVALNEPVLHQRLLDLRHGVGHARVIARQETDGGDQKQARIDLLRAIRTDEAVEFLVEALLADFLMDGLSDLAPALEGALELEALRALDRAVEGDPGHDLGIDEVLRPAPHLPDALIRLLPGVLEMLDDRELKFPAGLLRREAAFPRLMQRIEQLAIDIELGLLVRGIADAHGRGLLVSWQPGKLDLVKPALAGDTVHDLHLLGAAGERRLY